MNTYLWRASATVKALRDSCFLAGIDGNAVRIADPQDRENPDDVPAQVDFPSSFCPDSEAFVLMLGALASRGGEYSVSVVRPSAPGHPDDFVAVLNPKLDPVAARELAMLDPRVATQFADLGERVALFIGRMQTLALAAQGASLDVDADLADFSDLS